MKIFFRVLLLKTWLENIVHQGGSSWICLHLPTLILYTHFRNETYPFYTCIHLRYIWKRCWIDMFKNQVIWTLYAHSLKDFITHCKWIYFFLFRQQKLAAILAMCPEELCRLFPAVQIPRRTGKKPQQGRTAPSMQSSVMNLTDFSITVSSIPMSMRP